MFKMLNKEDESSKKARKMSHLQELTVKGQSDLQAQEHPANSFDNIIMAIMEYYMHSTCSGRPKRHPVERGHKRLDIQLRSSPVTAFGVILIEILSGFKLK